MRRLAIMLCAAGLFACSSAHDEASRRTPSCGLASAGVPYPTTVAGQIVCPGGTLDVSPFGDFETCVFPDFTLACDPGVHFCASYVYALVNGQWRPATGGAFFGFAGDCGP